MGKRRILYVARSSRGGSAVSLYHLIKGLDNNRYTPTVLFYAQENPYIGSKLAESGVTVLTLEKQQREHSPVSSMPVKRRDIAKWLETHCGKWASRVYVSLKLYYQFMRQDVPRIWPIARMIREKGIDLIHLNSGLRNGKPGLIAAWLTGVPCVCHVRMFAELNHFDRILARAVDTFVFISSAVAQDHITQGVPPAKGTVVHNAVDLESLAPTYDATSVRSEFGWTADERVVGIIGRLDWWKGHEYFLEAMAEVSQQIPNLRGLIIGAPEATPLNSEYFQKLQSLTKSLGLEGKVVFTGFRSDVPRLLFALDVVVHASSLPEPFGRVIIEGMAAGKPVVATAAGGVLDIIEDGVNGLLVPCKDSKAIAEAVLGLFSDREKAGQMGLAARQRVEERFTVQSHVAVIQTIYDSILAASQDSRADGDHRAVRSEPSLQLMETD